MDCKLDNLEFHNIFFDLTTNEITNYFKDFNITKNIPFYLNITSKELKTIINNNNSNLNQETLFILIPTNDNSYTEKEIEVCFKYILNKIKLKINIDLKDKILYKNIFIITILILNTIVLKKMHMEYLVKIYNLDSLDLLLNH